MYVSSVEVKSYTYLVSLQILLEKRGSSNGVADGFGSHQFFVLFSQV